MATEAHINRLQHRLERWNQAIDYYPELRRVRRLLDRNRARALDLDRAADAAQLERHYFSSVFHQRVGVTFSKWLRANRVATALELLNAGDHLLSEVAEHAGFGSVRAMQRAFKESLGMTPSEFRASVRDELRGPE